MGILLTFFTTHDAIAAEQALLAKGIPVRVMPVPGQVRAGCGIGLRIDDLEVLKQIELQPEGVYFIRQNQGEVVYIPCQI